MPGAGGEGGGRQRVLGRRSVLLVVAGGLLTMLAIVSLWSWRTFASSQGFADVTTDMLKEPAVREEVADQVVEALQDQTSTQRAAVAMRPALRSIVEQVVATHQFQGIFHAGVRQLHTAMVEGLRSRVNFNVNDSAQMVKASLREFNPAWADAIPDGAIVAVGELHGTPADTLIRTSSIAGWLAAPFAFLATLCFFFAVRWANDRRRAIEAIGFCLVIIGIAIFALLAVGVSLFAHVGSDPRERTALRAVFWSLSHLLNVQAKVAITIGAVLVVAASYVGRGRPAGRFRDAWEATRDLLSRPRGKVALSVLGIAAAAFAMAFPAATAAIAVRIGAFVAFVAGTVGVLDVISERDWSVGSSARVRQASTRLIAGSAGMIAAASVVLLFGGLAFARAIRAPNGDRPSMSEDGCNGHVELCDRRVDEVTFAGTHNSMAASSADGNWYFARHTDDIGAQLARGIHAFLIDLHYGYPSDNVVRTDYGDETEEAEARMELTPKEAARVAGFMGATGGIVDEDRLEVYLCHVYCEMGATLARKTFSLVHDFLRENPNEVVIFVVEDHVDAEDAIDAFADGGLADHAYAWQPGEQLPTLREMIESGKNLLVLVENEGGAAPWYIPAWEGALADTPFDFDTVDDFTCDPYRGRARSALLLTNHWLATDPATAENAAEANARAVLMERALECVDERDQKPNILAVDFSTEGDLLEVVDHLNGIPNAAET
jgi:hypothetical protein